MARDPARERAPEPRAELLDRTESSRYLERRDIPASWAAGNQIPPFVSSRKTGGVARKLRPVLWAAGIAATTAILGGVLGSERGWIYPAHGSTPARGSSPTNGSALAAHGSVATASTASYREIAATGGAPECAAAEKSGAPPDHSTARGDGKTEAALR